MLTLKECIDMSGLEIEEIEAIAEHEHIPHIAAAEMGQFLLSTAEGRKRIRKMISDDMRSASRCGKQRHAMELGRVLTRYQNAYPDCR